eukprot:517223_1
MSAHIVTSSKICNAVCKPRLRLFNALQFYQSLNIENKSDKDKLLKYYHNEYPEILADFIHLITIHQDEMDEIYDDAINNTNICFNTCDVVNCALSARHNRDRNKEHSENKSKTTNHEHVQFVFVRDLFDSIHCYIIHQYDFGYRIHKNDKIKIQQKTIVDSDEKNNSINISHQDETFKQMSNIIKKQTIKLQNNSRFTDSNKYKIMTNENKSYNDTNFFMDGLYKIKNNSKFVSFLEIEEYDTESVLHDISEKDQSASNIFVYLLNNMNDAKHIHDYFRHYYVSTHSFSTGFIFYYWTYYKHQISGNKPADGDPYGLNVNDHGGYSKSQLYIAKKYNGIKFEILNNTIFALGIYEYELSMIKANSLITESIVKKTEPLDICEEFHYGIMQDSTMTIEHLLSLILYCDWSDLCTEFSSTFRKEKSYESISSVIKRNMEFANWSRLLRETVELYGLHYPKDKFDIGVKGPFFTGISCELAIPEFNIRLNGPTSTSKQVEIARRFGDGGIVIQLNNNGSFSDAKLRTFSCAFISNYAAEDEYLFCGGRFGIKVESIVLQHTKQNFQQLIRALYYFDSMLNGTNINTTHISDTNYMVLDHFIRDQLQIDGFKNKYPKYINDTFSAFTNHKRQLIINLHDINTDKFKNMWKLIMNSSKNKSTLLKHVIFHLFPNVNRIVIYSALFDNSKNNYVYYEYQFNLLSLFDMISDSVPFMQHDIEIVIKATHAYGKNYKWKRSSWICSEMFRMSQSIDETQLRKHDKLSKELRVETPWDESIKEDWLIVKIKH